MKILVPLAEGFEEIETIVPVDVWRRAGFEVITAGLDDGPIRAARDTMHLADTLLEKVIHEKFDLIFIHGGNPGFINLGKHKPLLQRLKQQVADDQWIAAICGGPTVLDKADILQGKKFTCHPSVRDQLPSPQDARVIVDGKIVTGIAAGGAMELALEVVRLLGGEEKLAEVKKGLIC